MTFQVGREPFRPNNEYLLAVLHKVEAARDQIRGVAGLVERFNPSAHRSCMTLMEMCSDLKDEIANTPKPEDRYEDTTPHADLWDRMWKKADDENYERERPKGGAW